jgi:hypothetical protein
VGSKENAPPPQIFNFKEGPRKIGIFLCLAGMLAGGGVGELLREIDDISFTPTYGLHGTPQQFRSTGCVSSEERCPIPGDE